MPPKGTSNNPKGRPKGAPNKSTAEIKELAQTYSAKALETLSTIMLTSENDMARIAAAGYDSVPSFVHVVASDFNEIYRGRARTLALVKKNGQKKLLYVELEATEGGAFYDVKSAMLVRSDFLKNKELLWERAQSSQLPAESPSAVTGQNSSGVSVAIPANNVKSETNVPPAVASGEQLGQRCTSRLEDRTMDKATHKELVRKLRAYHAESNRRFKAWEESGYHHLMTPQYHPMSPELAGLTCGAKTRAGTPCKRKDIYLNGRCKFHGGLSTGPTTEEGKRKAAMNGVRPKKKRSP